MKNNAKKTVRVSTLHRGEIVPITDPAEIAELERRIRAAEKAMANGRPKPKKAKPRKGK